MIADMKFYLVACNARLFSTLREMKRWLWVVSYCSQPYIRYHEVTTPIRSPKDSSLLPGRTIAVSQIIRYFKFLVCDNYNAYWSGASVAVLPGWIRRFGAPYNMWLALDWAQAWHFLVLLTNQFWKTSIFGIFLGQSHDWQEHIRGSVRSW